MMTRERLAELQVFSNALGRSAGDPAARDAALAERPEPERGRLAETMAGLYRAVGSLATFVPTLVTAARYLRHDGPFTRGQKIASVGFCMGGGLSTLLAAHDPELAAAVAFYGPPPPLDLVPRIACPLLAFYADNDPRINEGVPAFIDAIRRAGKRFDTHTYPGTLHGFFNDGRPSYDVAATRDSFWRTLGLLRETLA